MVKCYRDHAALDRSYRPAAWDVCKYDFFLYTEAFIPVVTFLAPLASNLEGLKDR